MYAEEGVMPGTPSDPEESANETNSNEQVLHAKKIVPSCGIFLVMAFVEKLNPLNYNLTL